MLTLGIALLGGVLFLLCYVSLRIALELFSARWSRTKRLRAHQDRRTDEAWRRSRFGRPYEHVADLMAAAGWRLRPDAFAMLMAAMALGGAAVGLLLFQSARSALLLSAVMGVLPYSLLRMRLISRQLAARLYFLPAIELFYQCYLVTGSRHVRTALQKMVEERQLPGEAQAIFEALYRNLCVQGDDERSLRTFALAVGHAWADYYVSMMKVALSEGNNIGDNLKELIDDMRKARMDDQAERHRLLEIRLANFSPVGFLGLFLGINFRLNPEGSYRYYVLDPSGRGMLLNALVLLFGSFLMGLYLSRRKM
ncbi:type II secretion system F family protein [Cohnella sp. REN36]|uniref:type II secretion system F family protein n=1 Tax=Cohnella sp. REN36 TaxID=2887347 RepID=UPI001D1585E3|nr:hypothetical protein [Cohnella sp. REN36]MCC3375823.1 hypothetical protein [Cohnella sp. REN36]